MAANEQRSRGGGPPPPPPPPTGGAHGGGGGGGGHSRGPSPQSQGSKQASYKLLVGQWGIKLSPNIQNLVNQAANGGFSSDYFITLLQKTPEFHARFPGIYGPRGTLKMLPQQYIAQERSYQDQAARYGLSIGRKQIGWMVHHNISPAKAAVRFQADAVIQQNPEYFQSFNEELKARGMKALGYKGAQKFLLGAGNAKEYAIWQGASTRHAAEQAGISVGGPATEDMNLSESEKKMVAQKGFSQAQATAHFQNLSQLLGNILPESQIQGFGLTKADLIQAEFGGPKQAQINQMIQQLSKNQQAFDTGQVTSKTGNLGQRAAQGERAQV